ncbi:MAG: alpha/beta hydrolase, partial [Bacteroidetes bacterium]|nr:alpha/beta hydrolase [Bacteroidota bacterium]
MIEKSNYTSPPLLFNKHLQTILPAVFRKVKGVDYQRERITIPDGDFLDLDWLRNHHDRLVIISHGLEGNSKRSH